MGFLFERRSERWVVRPCTPPRLLRYCPGCGAAREFVCAGRFRMNAQKKTLDVWLKYRCAACDSTWKAPILERIPTAQLDAALREAFERDDAATVERYAYDVARWRRDVIDVVYDDGVAVERTAIPCECAGAALACVHFETPVACDVRLDRLLAAEWRISRTQLQRLFEAGSVSVWPDAKDGLRRRVRTGMWVRMDSRLSGVEE